MATIDTTPETVYVGYSAEELAYQDQAWSEAMSDLGRLRATWQRRADRARLEQAVTQMATALSFKGPLAPGRELPFMLERKIDRSRQSAPASGIRRVAARKPRAWMSRNPAAALAAIVGMIW